MIKDKKTEQRILGGETISVLTGDFLAPYLLSSFDGGLGISFKALDDRKRENIGIVVNFYIHL